MKTLLIVLVAAVAFSCSESEDPSPLPAKRIEFTDANTIAKFKAKAGKVHVYLLSTDTLSFINIIPNPERTGVFDYDEIEGTPGKFKNASYASGGVETQLLSAGRLEIRTFSDTFVDLDYDITFQSGKRLQGSYSGEISALK